MKKQGSKSEKKIQAKIPPNAVVILALIALDADANRYAKVATNA